MVPKQNPIRIVTTARTTLYSAGDKVKGFQSFCLPRDGCIGQEAVAAVLAQELYIIAGSHSTNTQKTEAQLTGSAVVHREVSLQVGCQLCPKAAGVHLRVLGRCCPGLGHLVLGNRSVHVPEAGDRINRGGARQASSRRTAGEE
jgi:hypothetical protein